MKPLPIGTQVVEPILGTTEYFTANQMQEYALAHQHNAPPSEVWICFTRMDEAHPDGIGGILLRDNTVVERMKTVYGEKVVRYILAPETDKAIRAAGRSGK